MSIESYRAQVRENIATYGRNVTGVSERPPFCYTIGNSLAGVPELLMIAVVNNGVMNEISEQLKTDPTPRDVSLGGQFPVRLRAVTDPAFVRGRYTIQAGQVLGNEDYPVLQVLVPDPAGRYPGDPGIDPRYDVPLV